MASPIKGKFFKKFWIASFFIIVCSIQKEWNARIFENKVCSLPQIHKFILLRLSRWIKGWGDHFPYNANKVIWNPLCLHWSLSLALNPNLEGPQPSPVWSPPPINVMKRNVDASLNTIFRKSAIKGVLTNRAFWIKFVVFSHVQSLLWKLISRNYCYL